MTELRYPILAGLAVTAEPGTAGFALGRECADVLAERDRLRALLARCRHTMLLCSGCRDRSGVLDAEIEREGIV